jgi:nitrogenase subunit NifH
MTVEKKIGIWMDHANAHLVEYTNGTVESKIIESKFTHHVMEQTLNESEQIMHNKQNHEQAEYYKKIADVIRAYDFVLLFGPTDAKAELHNLLKNDHLFSKIRIEIKSADKMNDTQIHTFVREYFAAH